MKLRVLAAMAAVAALGFASAAGAATINLTGTFTNGGSGGPSLYFDDITFLLPVGFTNAELVITEFTADDRAVAQLNGGSVVDQTGIFGPGPGGAPILSAFDFGAGNVPLTYLLGNGARDVHVLSGFVAGSNTVRITVNDTFNGIYGTLTNGASGPAGPTGYTFSGFVTYDEGGAVPEPMTWALMIAGFGASGAMLRRRRALAA